MNAAEPLVMESGYSIIAGHDGTPTFVPGSFDDLARHLQSHTRAIPITQSAFNKLSKAQQKAQKNGPGIVLAKFNAPSRTLQALAYTTALGLDIDQQHVEFDELRTALDGTSAIVYESLQSTAKCRRWRVIIEYAHPLTAEEHASAFEVWRARVPGVAEVKDAVRMWYGVQQFKGAKARIIARIEGKPYLHENVPVRARQEVRRAGTWKRPYPWSDRELADAFKRLCLFDPDMPYPQWHETLRAFHEGSHGSGEGYEAWEAWSSQGGKSIDNKGTYDTWKLWEACTPGRGTGPGTLFSDDGTKHWPRLPVVESTVRVAAIEDASKHSLTGDALLDFEPGEEPWLVHELITVGAHLLAGRGKGGKSWFTLAMALALAKGLPFLGRSTRQCETLWLTPEDTKKSLSRRLRTVGTRTGGALHIYTMEALEAERAQWTDETTFEQWLEGELVKNPSIGFVIIDTQKSCEALWANEQIDQKRHASVVDIAYQSVRLYEKIAQRTHTCIMMLHHFGKQKLNRGTDIFEHINMPATVNAAATGILAYCDHPEKDPYDDEDKRRVLGIRGRHLPLGDSVMMIESASGVVNVLGKFSDVELSASLAEVLEAIEALLKESETTTLKDVAGMLGKHVNSVQRLLARGKKKAPGGRLLWKGRELVSLQGKGLMWR